MNILLRISADTFKSALTKKKLTSSNGPTQGKGRLLPSQEGCLYVNFKKALTKKNKMKAMTTIIWSAGAAFEKWNKIKEFISLRPTYFIQGHLGLLST